MKVQIHNKYITAFLIGLIWFIAMLFMGNTPVWQSNYSTTFIYVFMSAMLLTLLVIHIYRPNNSESRRQRKVEKLLSQLDSEERSILFNQLTTPSDEGEYDSLEHLLSEQKRKRS